MNRLIKNRTHKLPVLTSIFILSVIGVGLFYTKPASADWYAYLDSTYTVYKKWLAWDGLQKENKYDILYYSTTDNGWKILADTYTPEVKLDGYLCDTVDTHVGFDTAKVFMNCTSLTITAYNNSTWFNEAKLAFKVGDVDHSETMFVGGGRILYHGESTYWNGWPTQVKAYAGQTTQYCNSPNPRRSDGCSVLAIFGNSYSGSFKINVGAIGSEHEYYYDGPSTKAYRTLTFNPNGGSVSDAGDGVSFWLHKSGDNALREYVLNNTASKYPVPTKAGYEFSGWYTEPIGGTQASSSRVMSSDETYYAHWNTGAYINPASSVTQYVEPGETVIFTHQIDPSLSVDFGVDYQIKRQTFAPGVEPTDTPGADSTCIVGVDASCPNPATKSFSAEDEDLIVSGNDSSFVVDAPLGSQICEYLTLSNPSDVAIGTPNPSRACTTVVARPYVKFLGEDVNFCSGTGDVYTWAKLDDNDTPEDSSDDFYIGSSSQYALFVYNEVNADDDKEGFFTSASATVTNPKQLTFANNLAEEPFGNSWGPMSDNCTSYFDQEGSDTVIANETIAGNLIDLGENRTKYVNGNAYITGDIRYNTAGWTANNIPSYRLIVSGDIYIDGNVTQLDGFYFAGGNIYTCSVNDPSYEDYDPIDDPDYYTHCNNPLTVYGAFQALGSIKYWRTAGTLNLGVNDPTSSPGITNPDLYNAAEFFYLSPEMYLSKWLNGVPSGGATTGLGDIQSIRSLPPIF